jgi:glycosyltransferase involved in cell wall biosynthesis
MKYNVVYISAVHFFKGGAEFALKSFLQNPDVNARLIVPAEGDLADKVRAMGIPVDVVDYGAVLNIRRPFKISQGFMALWDAAKAALEIRRIAKAHNALYIHSNGLKVHAIACLSRFVGAGKVVCHIHDIPYTKPEKIFWQVIDALATRIVLVSRYCWHGQTIPRNAVIIHNGIPIEDRPLFAKTCGIPVKVGFIGRIHPHKGLHLLIDWLRAAKERGMDFTLSVRGEADLEQTAYLQSIKDTIEKNSFTNRCTFEGRIFGYEKIYDNLDVVVMPSVTAEPFGLVAIESYERGIPCIAYPSGALPDLVKHGKTGMLCRTEDEFLNAYTRLTTEPAFYQSIREAAFEDVKKNYSLAALHAALNRLYSSMW